MDEATTRGQVNLRVLSENTGGFANVNNNEFRPGVARVLSEAGHHYLLACSSPSAGDGEYHRIQVQVRRPGLAVRARHGYQAIKPRVSK
jgi:hypothetical protein